LRSAFLRNLTTVVHCVERPREARWAVLRLESPKPKALQCGRRDVPIWPIDPVFGGLRMKAIRGCAGVACLVAAVVAFGADESATVTIRNAHLCCGGCVDGAKSALDGLEGISEVKADVNSKSIVFAAKSEQAAMKGIESLADHGFFGKAAFGKKDLNFPEVGAKKGEKRDSLTFTGVHLCCGACRKAVHEAFTKLDGMTSMEIDAAAQTVKLNGAGLVVADAVALLQKAGFYGKLAKAEKK